MGLGEQADGEGVAAQRVDRRTLIKGAAAAGALAWTAPVIIDSLTSPAGAATLNPGCYRGWFSFQANPGSCQNRWQVTDPGGTPVTCTLGNGPCASTPTAQDFDGTVSVSFATSLLNCPPDGTGEALTLTVVNGVTCRIVSAAVRLDVNGSGTDVCRAATTDGSVGQTDFTGFTTKTLVIDPTANDRWDNATGNRSTVGIVLQCP